MPSAIGRKRRTTADDNVSESSPEPPTQRRRSDPAFDDDEEEAHSAEQRSGMSDAELGEMVKKMVRLALACEYARRPIRRQEISEKVLGAASRQFKKVFDEAQRQLRTVFGMHMVELPAREKVTLQQRRAAQKSGTQGKPVISWILQSTLPAHYRMQDTEVMHAPSAPTMEEETKYIGICTFVVSLLLLYGGTLSDAKMARYLRRVGLEDRTPVQGYEETEKLFKRMERDGYVNKIKESAGVGEDDMSWVVGPRGRVEIGEAGARGFALAVYGDLPVAANADLNRRIEKSLAMSDRVTSGQPRGEVEKKKRGRKRKSGALQDDDDDDDNNADMRDDTDQDEDDDE